MCDASDPDIAKIIESKYPNGDDYDEIDLEDLDLWKHGPTPLAFSSDEIEKAIRKKRKGTGADQSRWAFDDLKAIAKITGNYDYMVPITNAIVRGQFTLEL